MLAAVVGGLLPSKLVRWEDDGVVVGVGVLHLEWRWAGPDQTAERTQTRQQEAGSRVNSGNVGAQSHL